MRCSSWMKLMKTSAIFMPSLTPPMSGEHPDKRPRSDSPARTASSGCWAASPRTCETSPTGRRGGGLNVRELSVRASVPRPGQDTVSRTSDEVAATVACRSKRGTTNDRRDAAFDTRCVVAREFEYARETYFIHFDLNLDGTFT